MNQSPAMCPSAPPQEGALLLGRFNKEGRLAFAASPLPVTAEFLAAAEAAGGLTKRFRFSARCMEKGCSRWENGQCAVGKAAAVAAARIEKPAHLPHCVIRPQCRWFEQQGELACRTCPHVVYDMTEEAELAGI